MMVKQIHDISRRGFLGLSAAAAMLVSPLRRVFGADPAGTGGGFEQFDGGDYAAHVYSLTGGWTPGGFRVTSQLDPVADVGKSVKLAVSPNQNMSGYTLTSATTVDGDGLARFVVTNLNPLTRYWCRLAQASTSTMFGDQFNGWTRPANGEANYTFDVVVGSCLGNAGSVDQYGSQAALADAANLNAPLFLHLGDFGYWGQKIDVPPIDTYKVDLAQYRDAMTDARLDQLRRLIHGSNIEACISDHELHANGDTWRTDTVPVSTPDAHGCKHSKRQISAHRKLFPVATWGDASPLPAVHRGYYLDLAPHIRLVVSDLRSPERNESTDPDTDAKQLWGATQEDWLFNHAFDVPADTIILFVNETVWWHRGTDVTDDKPASYPNAQTRFVNWLIEHGDPPLIDRFVWIGGDRHYNGFVSAADADVNGDPFPQFIGSGFSKNSLTLHEQEDMTWRTQIRTNKYAWFPVVGYLKLTITYTAATRTLTVSGIARRVESTHREISGCHLDGGSKIVTCSSGPFAKSDEDRIITGRYVPDKLQGEAEIADDGPTTVETFIDKWTIEMSEAAPGNAPYNDVLISIASNPTGWTISDYPTPSLGGPGIVTFTV